MDILERIEFWQKKLDKAIEENISYLIIKYCREMVEHYTNLKGNM